jgi:hypothetical protein
MWYYHKVLWYYYEAKIEWIHVIEVGFEVLMAASMKMAVILVVAQCSLVEVYQFFPDGGGRKDLCNISELLPDYGVLHQKDGHLQ